MPIKHFVLAFLCAVSCSAFSQKIDYQKDSTMMRQLYTESLENGQAYPNLRSLCQTIGNRLSGSLGAEMAVKWGQQLLQKYPFDKVYLQPVTVPNWERGTKEQCYYTTANGEIHKLTILAIGGSVGTDGIIKGKLVLFKSLKALENADKSEVEGKIVFVAQHMNQDYINAFHAYGNAYPVRGHSAVAAALKGAKAVVIRSLSLSESDFPNTGTMHYVDSVKKIPAAAISTEDATALEKYMEHTDKAPTLYLQMGCKWYPDAQSYNVIAEMKGSKYPNQIITVGGHLDSWDVGEGAHDDGAGIMGSLEALRLLQAVHYRPTHTLRVVFFMNEENGSRGGKMYAKKTKEKGEKQIYAIESDEGGFTPRGFDIDGEQAFTLAQKFKPLFAPYFIHYFKKGSTGEDVSKLKAHYNSVGLFELVPDSQRYFTIHHNNNDVFKNINRRELQLGAATISSLVYLLDKYGE